MPDFVFCRKFGKLILGKIIKIFATRCHTFKLKCTKFDFGWGSAPDPAGELTALPGPLTGFKGPTSKGREGRTGGKGNEGDRKERAGEGRIEEGKRTSVRSPSSEFATTPLDITTHFACNVQVCYSS